MSRGWPVSRLGEIANIRSGSTPSKSRQDFWGGEYPWVSAKDMKTPVLTSSIDSLTSIGFASASVAPQDAILILTRGMTLFRDVPVCLAGRAVAFNQDLKALVPVEGVDPRYLSYYLRVSKQRLMNLVDSAGHGTGKLDTGALRDFEVSIPPLAEQQRIVRFLAVWDSAITMAERLIRLKTTQRTWLTSTLLDAPASSGEWPLIALGEICRAVTRKNTTGAANVLTSSAKLGLVDQREYFNKDVSGVDIASYHLIRRGEFAYNRSTSGGYPFGAIKRLDQYGEGVLSTLYLCFELLSKDVSSDYLCHFFESGVMNRELGQICQAGARSHGLLNVTKSDFFSLRIPLPPIETQFEIVRILDAADCQLTVLRDLLSAYRSQRTVLARRLFSSSERVSS